MKPHHLDNLGKDSSLQETVQLMLDLIEQPANLRAALLYALLEEELAKPLDGKRLEFDGNQFSETSSNNSSTKPSQSSLSGFFPIVK